MADEDAILAIGGVALVALVGAVIIGLSSGPEHDYAQLCQNAEYIRVEDQNCGNNGSFVMYIATNSNYNVPAVGNKLDQKHVIRTVPAGKTIQTSAAVPSNGGVVKSSSYIVRGGFGGKSGSSGG